MSPRLQADVLEDGFLELLSVGAAEGVDFFTVFDEDEGWHAGNIVSHGQIFAFVNVDLAKKVEISDKIYKGNNQIKVRICSFTHL